MRRGREGFSSRPRHLVDAIDSLSQLLFLLRFLCFMALFYLALHRIVARFSQKPDSKLRWFFGVLTAPLVRPVRAWVMPGASEDHLLSRALLFYGVLWLCLVVLGRIMAIAC
jgi:uncharacterized protein YggT (Ycf19 family)